MKAINRMYSVALAMVTIISFLAPLVSAGDFSFYSIGKGLYYDQFAGGQPVLRSPRSWLFTAQLVASSNAVFSVTLGKLPLGSLSLSPNFPAPNIWTAVRRHATQQELDGTFPATNYSFRILTINDGIVFVTNSMPNAVYPNPPAVTNLGVAQNLDAAADITLGWDAFSGGTTSDLIFLQIQRGQTILFKTPDMPGTNGALDGTATSLVIPAGTLESGKAYVGRLVFARTLAISTNYYPGAWGVTHAFSQTDFWIKTQGGGDTTPPEISASNPTNGASGLAINQPLGFYFSEPMAAGFGYSLTESSSGSSSGGIGTPDWSPDGTTFVLTSAISTSTYATLWVTLNPFDRPLSFADKNGNPLAPETVLTFNTTGGHLAPAHGFLTNGQVDSNGVFHVDVTGEPDYRYSLQSSTDSTNWSNVGTNIAFRGTAQFADTNGPTGFFRIYRALSW